MDRLNDEQRKAISKLTTTRLAIKLAQTGLNEGELEAMNKEAMVQAWAQAVAAAARPERTGIAYDVELEKQRLEFEMRKWEMDRQDRERRDEEERRLREDELQIKREEMTELEEWRKYKLRAAEELRTREEQQVERRAREERERLGSPVYQVKWFGDALRGTVAKMPNDALELIPWLCSVEKLFIDFGVSDNLKVHLLKPHLTEQARNLITRMDPVEAAQYEDVKRLLLHEFKLSSCALLERFHGLSHNVNETYTLYGNRLESVLSYYVESRRAV